MGRGLMLFIILNVKILVHISGSAWPRQHRDKWDTPNDTEPNLHPRFLFPLAYKFLPMYVRAIIIKVKSLMLH